MGCRPGLIDAENVGDFAGVWATKFTLLLMIGAGFFLSSVI